MNKAHDLMIEIKRLEAELLDEIQQQQESFFGTNAAPDGCFDKASRPDQSIPPSNCANKTGIFSLK